MSGQERLEQQLRVRGLNLVVTVIRELEEARRVNLQRSLLSPSLQ
jgi:hypothetical protein